MDYRAYPWLGKWMLSEVYQRMSGMFSNRVLNENMGINQDYLTLFPPKYIVDVDQL